MTYDHYSTMERIASLYTPISKSKRTGKRPAPIFFRANGLEDLYDMQDRLSSVAGTVMIAVDGCEADCTLNRADGLTTAKHYSVIVCQSCNNQDNATVAAAYQQCEQHCRQIRNYLLQLPELLGYLDRTMTINGIGPIGDNFHGCILSFTIFQPEDYYIDTNFWNI